MKKPLFLLTTALCAGYLQASVPVQETPKEFAAAADFDGDGHMDLIIANKETGEVKILIGGAADYFTPGSPLILGYPLSGLALADFGSGSPDRAILAAESAGSLAVLKLGADEPGYRTLLKPLDYDTFGPGKMAALRLAFPSADANRDDLVLATNQNGQPQVGALESFRTQVLEGPDHFASSFLPATRTAVELVTVRSKRSVEDPDFLAVLSGNNSMQQMLIFRAADGAIQHENAVGVKSDLDSGKRMAVFGQFGNSLAPRVLHYGRNQSAVHSYPLSIPASGTPVTIGDYLIRNFPTSISSVAVVPGQSDDPDRLLIVFTGGMERAALFSYDGVNFPTKIAGFSAPVGGDFTTGVGMPNGEFLLLESEGLSGLTSSVARYDHKGNFLSRTAVPESSPLAGRGNVMFYSGIPLAEPTARIVAVTNAGDWSSGVPSAGPLGDPLTVTAEFFQNPQSGLGGAAPTEVGAPPPGSPAALGNQFGDDISTFNFGGVTASVKDTVSIDPPAGNYQSAIELEFTSAENLRLAGLGQPEAFDILYRIDSGSQSEWRVYNPDSPVFLSHNATVRFLSRAKTGSEKSATATAMYSFSESGNLDSDGDGVPDFVEIGLGLDPLAGVDSDGDGYSDLEELLAGTDPNDPDSNPGRLSNGQRASGLAGGAFPLQVTVTTRFANGGNPINTRPVSGVSLDARSLEGGSLGVASTVADEVNTTATFPSLAPVAGEPYFAVLSPVNFTLATNPESEGGRELAALVEVPEVEIDLPNVTYTGWGNIENAAAQWIDALRALNTPSSGSYQIGSSGPISPTATAAQVKSALDAIGGGAGLFNSGPATVTGAFPLYRVSMPAPVGASSDAASVSNTLSPASDVRLIPLQTATAEEPVVEFFIYITRKPTLVPADLNPRETLLLLLVEHKLAQATGITQPTLLPSRFQDAGRIPITNSTLNLLANGLRLDSEAQPVTTTPYRFEAIVSSMRDLLFAPELSEEIAALLAITNMIYESSSEAEPPEVPDAATIEQFLAGTLPEDEIPASQPTPIDTLRQFLAQGTLPSTYPQPDALLIDAAQNGVEKLLDTPVARTAVLLTVVVGYDGGLLPDSEENLMMPGSIILYNADGSPYSFRAGFPLSLGTRLLVHGYNDLPGNGEWQTHLEVKEVSLLELPRFLGADNDNNLLVDQWEQIFFGSTGQNPYATGAGGKSLVQLYLDGSDPEIGSNNPVADLFPRLVQLEPTDPSGYILRWKFPPAYSDFFRFESETTSNLTQWSDSFVSWEDVVRSGEDHALLLGEPSNPNRQFWRLRLRLNLP